MVKLDYDRDYYADLELPPTADVAEVKKQFRKLALKWHPDRNPGKEDSVKEKFLAIQSAHEILTDPATKSKFDAYRQRSSRYPTASGIRGNPWQHTAQDVNQKFGAPPRRHGMPTRPPAPTTSASTTAWAWAGSAKAKTDTARANMDAWDRARPQPRPAQPSAAAGETGTRTARQARGEQQQRPPPPPPPRTAAQARRQEAAFGTRKAGYAPASPMGDEPPVRNQHYNTGGAAAASAFAGTAASADKPRPASAFVDPSSAAFSEAFSDNRQRTPYAANVGEKTNPFEPLHNVNRAKSMRDGTKRFQDGPDEVPPSPPSRQRSASVGSDNLRRSTDETPNFDQTGARPTFQFQSRASARYSPHGQPETTSAPPTATSSGPAASGSSANGHASDTTAGDTSDRTGNGAKVYETPFSTNYRNVYPAMSAGQSYGGPHSGVPKGAESPVGRNRGFPAYQPEASGGPTPSGGAPSSGANAFEARLLAQLQHLLRKTQTRPQPSAPATTQPSTRTVLQSNSFTNGAHPASFSVPLDGDSTAAPAQPAQPARFTRNSADSINTRFVAEEKGGANFQFSAGTADDGFLRAKQRARGFQSPLRNEFTASAQPPGGAPQTEDGKKQGNFVPEEWKEAFAPHIFEPPKASKPSTSPTRPIRPIKKPRPVRMTAGTAGMVDDDETSGEDKGGTPSAPAVGVNGTKSPSAMDIDTPPPEPSSAAQAAEARNINVEPTKPEWRAGDADGGTTTTGATVPTGGNNGGEPRLGAGLKMPNLNPNAAGSEDSEEFLRPMFTEFRNVEPFAQKAAGLGSFADLSSNLPFPSRPAAKVPVAHEKPKQLDIPSPPVAPRPPAALCVPGPLRVSAPAWAGYVREFGAYMGLWLEYNRRVTDHFAARQKIHERGGLGWLDALGERGVHEYLRALEEDKYVRQRWMAACDAHELHFREFLDVRERVRGS